MYWAITPKGQINNIGSESAAVLWSKMYPGDIVFTADLIPPIDA